MKRISNKLEELLSAIKLRNQFNIVYTLGFFIPMFCIGIFLMLNTSRLLTNYHEDLNQSNNLRAKTILFEITNQIYTLSEDITSDEALYDLLAQEYDDPKDFIKAAGKYDEINKYLNIYSELDDITIYSNNPTIQNYEKIVQVTEDIQNTSWYQRAVRSRAVFWMSQTTQDKSGRNYYNLCMVRQLTLANSVLVIKTDENYLRSVLVDTNNDDLLLYIDNGGIFFSSNWEWYDTPEIIYIDYDQPYYQFQGQLFINDDKYMATVNTIKLYQADNRIYVCSLDNSAHHNINAILSICLLIIVVSTILPFLLIRFFTGHFSARVDTLREAMHRASLENYDVPSKLLGEDEISQAFADLLKMVEKIKDKDAKMYEARINSQKLQNAQQRIEMEVLASQINPHFLYNTLETIRMKAFTAGDKDVANAIKLLGKSMRYVLDNTGISSTTLKNELDYIETYLQIQKLRFSGRINYSLAVEEDLNTQECEVLPLLLQPIVENAILHGLEETEEGIVLIEVYTKDKEYLVIDISDNGCGMEETILEEVRIKLRMNHISPNKNIGLYNINQRIRLCYGPDYGITIESEPEKGTKVSILLPL